GTRRYASIRNHKGRGMYSILVPIGHLLKRAKNSLGGTIWSPLDTSSCISLAARCRGRA
ncbi:hypothetical protein QBC46DRAFT_270057, partial [Diplogelasinospora grovesii]